MRIRRRREYLGWTSLPEAFGGRIRRSPRSCGCPGGAKNAIDYLYNKLTAKPVFIVSYGTVGGKSVSAQLENTFSCMKLRVVRTNPQLKLEGGGYGADTRLRWEGW